MHMDSQPENFENLRRLLALKRHEQPPPGYFDGFSREVILRLQDGEGAQQASWERAAWEAPWLARLWEALSLKPYLTGGFGVAACATVLAGVLYAERLDLPAMAENEVNPAPGGLAVPTTPSELALGPALASSNFGADTNLSFQPTIPSGLFNGSINPPQLVTWPPKGN